MVWLPIVHVLQMKKLLKVQHQHRKILYYIIMGGGNLPTTIQSLLVSNLYALMKERGIYTVISQIASINYSTLKCWMSCAKIHGYLL